MDVQIMTREAISEQAREAARIWDALGAMPTCPYPTGSDASAAWNASFQRWLLWFSSDEGSEAAGARQGSAR